MNKGFIWEILAGLSAAQENLIAVSIFDGHTKRDITYAQLSDDIYKVSGYFRDNNIKNQQIVIMGPNSYDWAVIFFSALASGNVVLPLNPDLSEDILIRQCEQADITLICRHDGTAVNLACCKQVLFSEMWHSEPLEPASVHISNSEDTVLMMCTSGTTGKSKIVEFSNQNIQSRITDILENDEILKEGSELIVLPFYHLSGLLQMIFLLCSHRTACLGRGIRYFLSDLPIFNSRVISLVPVALESLAKLFKKMPNPDVRLKYVGTALTHISVGGAQSNYETCRYMMEQGFSIQMAYGMTESIGSGTFCCLDPVHIGTIGKSYGKTVLQIMDGELVMRGPSVMKGYYKDPDEQSKVIINGWLHTGDLGYRDDDGFFYITGRKKNVIILANGENVNPEEIEMTFKECPAILESMVYSDRKGICADIYTKEEEATRIFINEYNARVPLYRQVYKINWLTSPLEKTATGKIKRKENL